MFLCTKSLRVISAWLDLSQRTNYSVRLTSLPGCKVESALNNPSGWPLHYVGTYCFNTYIQDEQDDGVKP